MKVNYVNGIYDSNGKELIRPMTQEEKDFLNKFQQEYYYGKLSEDETDLHYNLIQSTKEEVSELEQEWSEITDIIENGKVSRHNYFKLTREEQDIYKESRKELLKRKREIEDRLSEIDYKKNIYNKDNAERRDIENRYTVISVTDLPIGSFSGLSESKDSYPEWTLFESLVSSTEIL